MQAHNYVSSACEHGAHRDCRAFCAVCHTPCLCSCHHLDALLDSGERAHRKLDALLAQGALILMATTETKAAMKRIDDATTAIGERISALIAKIGTGMTQAEVDEVNAGLGAEADKLEGMAKDPDAPIA